MKKLVCVGACYLDTILDVPYYPGEDSKLRATNLQVRRGGNCPNTLQVLQQLLRESDPSVKDVKPYLISCLPSVDAPAAATIVDSFGPGSLVNFSRCIFRANHRDPASSYIIRSEATGSRTLVNYNDLPEMTIDEFVTAADEVGDEAWFHFEARSRAKPETHPKMIHAQGRIPETTLQCIRYLRRSFPNTRVSVEVEKPGRGGLEDLAAEADVVFYSRSWAESKRYESAQRCLSAQSGVARKANPLLAQDPPTMYVGIGRCIVSITSQREGRVLPGYLAWATHFRSGRRSSRKEASERENKYPDKIVGWANDYLIIPAFSTVGAGDTFIAGMLFGLLCHHEDWDTERKVQFAVQLATCKVQRDGFDGVGAEALKHF
ncbi:Ribokinase-like protein [Rostrohypoxylon terebratum]|nr:Ribokinase-like protein [Rostrohypoxylon terebratum]